MIAALVTLSLLHATPSSNASLDQARAQADDFDYAGALRSLDAAWAQQGNSRDTTVAILELQGIVWGNLNKAPKARDAFVTLLILEPERALSGDHPPRVRTPFYEAKELASRLGPLTIARAPPSKEADQISAVAVTVGRDAQKLVRGVRFHLEIGDNTREAVVTPDARGLAPVATVATEVRWWAELLGERDAVLETLGSAAEPLVESALGPPKPLPKPAPRVEAGVARPPPSASAVPAWLRPTGLGLAGVGAIAAAAGVYFGVASTSARALFTNATRDSTGAITSLTQVQAQEADHRAIESAAIANTLFGTAAGLAGLGVVCFVLGGPGDVTVAPAPGGATVSGRF